MSEKIDLYSMPLLLKVNQVAFVLGFTRKKVGEMIRNRELPCIPLGRHHKRVPRASVEEWIRSRTVRTADEFKRAVDGRRAK
jgi:excisionase family DNA binding protein